MGAARLAAWDTAPARRKPWALLLAAESSQTVDCAWGFKDKVLGTAVPRECKSPGDWN